jgi:hypothetical protein
MHNSQQSALTFSFLAFCALAAASSPSLLPSALSSMAFSSSTIERLPNSALLRDGTATAATAAARLLTAGRSAAVGTYSQARGACVQKSSVRS